MEKLSIKGLALAAIIGAAMLFPGSAFAKDWKDSAAESIAAGTGAGIGVVIAAGAIGAGMGLADIAVNDGTVYGAFKIMGRASAIGLLAFVPAAAIVAPCHAVFKKIKSNKG